MPSHTNALWGAPLWAPQQGGKEPLSPVLPSLPPWATKNPFLEGEDLAKPWPCWPLTPVGHRKSHLCHLGSSVTSQHNHAEISLFLHALFRDLNFSFYSQGPFRPCLHKVVETIKFHPPVKVFFFPSSLTSRRESPGPVKMIKCFLWCQHLFVAEKNADPLN